MFVMFAGSACHLPGAAAAPAVVLLARLSGQLADRPPPAPGPRPGNLPHRSSTPCRDAPVRVSTDRAEQAAYSLSSPFHPPSPPKPARKHVGAG